MDIEYLNSILKLIVKLSTGRILAVSKIKGDLFLDIELETV